MAQRTNLPAPTSPDWPPDKPFEALTKQLAELDQFRGKHFREVENAEQGWINLTENILARGFGKGSNNVSQFHMAKWAGQHRTGMSDGEIQNNFKQRIGAFEANLFGS